MENKLPSDEVQRKLKIVIDHFTKEDSAVRERQIRTWKKLKYYWSGFQRLWWSDVAHDWRVFDVENAQSANDASYYDKPINIFRAYLESIIAALSVTTPSINCYPDDADNPLDLSTAKAGDKIADLIYKHNDAALLWIHALYIYCTEGMVAAYSYPKEDYEFGSYNVEKYKDVEEEQDVNVCPTCGTEVVQDEFQPDDILGGNPVCPQCNQSVVPVTEKKKLVVTRFVGITTKPKSRQCIEVYGGLYVKVANYAMKQADTPYLIFAYETHYSNAIERFPHLRGKSDRLKNSYGGMRDPYEQWGRLSTQYFGDYPTNTCSIRNCWLRPSSFNVLNDEDDVKELKKLYPDGVKVVLVNEDFGEVENESLDDCWTLTQNPLSDYLHYDALGLLLTSVQEIANDITSLTIQTIEHGIPQTFADPDVLNFDQYRQSEVSPGAIYPVKPSSGKKIGDAFYEVKTATLSGEVLPFAQRIQELGQVVSGALPSLFGGAAPNSSKTAAQYSMSRNQALQRLQTPWKMLNVWWKTIFGKVIPAYIKCVVEDEKIVNKDESGNFVNVFVRKAELEGKIGSVELESSDQLPVTWAQKKDIIMQLLQAANPLVMQALSSPENIPLIAQAIGLDDFNIPGEDDRQKQYEEIKILLSTEPIMDEMGQEVPSVDVEPLVDNHAMEADICRRWLVSDAGRLAKTEMPSGYRNILLHMKHHMDMMAALAPPMGAQSQEEPEMKPMAQKLPQGGSNATVQ